MKIMMLRTTDKLRGKAKCSFKNLSLRVRLKDMREACFFTGVKVNDSRFVQLELRMILHLLFRQ